MINNFAPIQTQILDPSDPIYKNKEDKLIKTRKYDSLAKTQSISTKNENLGNFI